MKPRVHSRLLSFPANQSLIGGRLDALHLQTHGERTDLIFDYHELQFDAPTTLLERDGKLWEEGQGVYTPRRIHFRHVKFTEGGELCTYFDDLPADHPDRILKDAFAWRSLQGESHYLFGLRVKAYPTLIFVAQRCRAEERDGPTQTTAITRNWSPSPRSPARMVPHPKHLHQRYGGNPIAIQLNGRRLKRRLFIGGLYCQSEQRPAVHTVLNLSEKASLWTVTTPAQIADRWATKGEGSQGMTVNELVAEARWVIERLQAEQRVLVHCSAGMNRSATVCCAVLILLEGLSAEAALERVREQHAWALPDGHYWLALRWLASLQ